ncbi:MAG: cytochrome c, partial [bacterium]
MDYDEWTKDWTIRAGVDPTDRSQWKRWSRLGVGKPVPDRPRDLHAGVYRGGASSQDLYRRIAGGIDGSPMPALPLKPANPQGWTSQDVWDLVHFVRWLPYSEQFPRE